MLKIRNYVKGKQILTAEDLINATSTLFLKDKRCKSVEVCIDNPVNSVLSIFEKDKIKEFLEAGLENYDIWERIEEDRDIVFSDKVDNMLDDMLSSFALEYADNEYHEAELMEKFLHELKDKFRIEVRENE